MSQAPRISIDTDTVTEFGTQHQRNATQLAANANWDVTGYPAALGDVYGDFTDALTKVAPIRQRAITASAEHSKFLATRASADVAAFEESTVDNRNMFTKLADEV